MDQKTDHVVIRNTATGDYELECRHCGTIKRPTLPMSVDKFTEFITQFNNDHQHCPPPLKEFEG